MHKNLSRDDLAKIVGTAPESVIGAFRFQRGMIKIESGKITVTQPTHLEKVIRWSPCSSALMP